MGNTRNAKEYFKSFVPAKNLLAHDFEPQYYNINGGVVEYTEASLGKIKLFGVTVLTCRTIINEFSAVFFEEWRARTYVRTLLDSGLYGTIKGENIAIATLTHFKNQES